MYLFLVLLSLLFATITQVHGEELFAAAFGALINVPFLVCFFNKNLNLDVSLTKLNVYGQNDTIYLLSEAADRLNAQNDFKTNNTNIILVPGFGASSSDPAVIKVMNDLKTLPNTNIYLLDYSSYCKSSTINIVADYQSAVTYLYYVAKAFAAFLVRFIELLGVSLDKVHLIGHSLGAHLCGITGSILLNSHGKQLKKIWGLDPARPCFKTASKDDMLDSSDASWVEVYHSNMQQLGVECSFGHINFYPDGGGPVRPACQSNNLIQEAVCSHSRIVFEIVDTVVYNPAEFIGRACDSWSDYQNCKCVNNSLAVAGNLANANATAKHYFYATNTNQPWGQGIGGATPDACK